MPSAFHAPLAALILLVAVVWTLAVARRVREIRSRRLNPQALARPRDVAVLLEDTQAMDNLNNLLQMPLLFLVLCLAYAQVGETSPILLAGCWLYVLLRVAHSAIQIGPNRVLRRFQVWMLGNAVLFGLWLAFAIRHLVLA